jgi:hypothetical protein
MYIGEFSILNNFHFDMILLLVSIFTLFIYGNYGL